MRPVIACLAVALAGCTVPPSAPAPPEMVQRVALLNEHPCAGATARALTGAGLTADQIRELFFQPMTSGGIANRVIGYLAWSRIAGQPGFLVADMDPDCHMRTVYTRDGMQLAGLPAF